VRKALSKETLRSIYGRIAKRYDFQHGLITAKADQRGRKILVNNTVQEGDRVLDCGAGTGTTGILAAMRAGPQGTVTMFDLSEAMLAVARGKVAQLHVPAKVRFQTGDMVHLPFADNSFDVVLRKRGRWSCTG
jgi:demethylmenaquinone methyltransferase/2-methoxy-6-polyprenyl-1,4-benzoquinol methylase